MSAADPVFLDLVNGLTTVNTPEARGLQKIIATKLGSYEPFVGANVATVYNLLYKGTVPNDNKPLQFSMRGTIKPVYMPYEPKQGDHLLTKYHPHTKMFRWETNAKFTIRTSVSVNILDVEKFNTPEEVKEAVNNDILAFAEAPLYFWGWFVMALFSKDSTELKKWQTGKEGNKGIWGQLEEIYRQSNGASDGYSIMTYMNTLEGKLGIWGSDQSFKGFPEISGTSFKSVTSGDTIGRVVKKCPLLDILDAIKDCIFKNEVSASKTAIKFFTATGSGSADSASLKGWYDTVQTVVREIITERYAKHLLCVGCAKADGTCNDKIAKLKEGGYNLGCCISCSKDNKCCTCIPPMEFKGSDLVILIHPDTASSFNDLAPILPNPALCEFNAANMGVGQVIELPFLEKDKIFLMHKDTIAIHGVSERFGERDESENYIINRWRDLRYNIGLYNLPCVVIKKPT